MKTIMTVVQLAPHLNHESIISKPVDLIRLKDGWALLALLAPWVIFSVKWWACTISSGWCFCWHYRECFRRRCQLNVFEWLPGPVVTSLQWLRLWLLVIVVIADLQHQLNRMIPAVFLLTYQTIFTSQMPWPILFNTSGYSSGLAWTPGVADDAGDDGLRHQLDYIFPFL